MVNVKSFVLIVVLLFSARWVQSATWIDRVISWTINGDFKRAETFLQQKITETDSALAPCFYFASVLNSKMNYQESLDDSKQFEQLLQYIIHRVNKQLNQHPLPEDSLARLYFYRGSAYGYLAYFEGQTAQWFKAFKDGLKAIRDLEAAVQIDSTLYQAYLGLGTYKYWRSTKLKAILWLPFIKDLRKEGIADIKHALHDQSIRRYMAMHQLIYILIDYQHYDETLMYAQQAIQRFPKSPFMWWAYAHVYFKSHNYPKALKAYQHLLTLIEGQPQAIPSQWLACQVRIAELYRRMGQMKLAKQAAQLILQKRAQFPDNEKNRQRLKKAQEILSE